MREFGSHLLFHLGAIVLGAAIGVAGTIYWRTGDLAMLGLCAAALVFGLVLLLVQTLYISNKDATDRRRRDSERRQARQSAPQQGARSPARPEAARPRTSVFPTTEGRRTSGTRPEMEAADPDATTRASGGATREPEPEATRQLGDEPAPDDSGTGIIDDTTGGSTRWR